MQNSIRQQRDAHKGVTSPKHTQAAVRTIGTRVQSDVTRVQRAVPSMRSVAATASRKTKSAAPGAPNGNMENSLCTVESLR